MSSSRNVWTAIADAKESVYSSLLLLSAPGEPSSSSDAPLFSPISVDSQGYSPLHSAVAYGRVELLTRMQAPFLSDSRYVQHVAALELRLLRRLLLAPEKTADGVEALYLVREDDEFSGDHLLQLSEEVEKLIKGGGADVKVAFAARHLALVKALLENGDDGPAAFRVALHAPDADGDAAFNHFAIGLEDLELAEREATLELLLAAGCDPTLRCAPLESTENVAMSALQSVFLCEDEGLWEWLWQACGKELTDEEKERGRKRVEGEEMEWDSDPEEEMGERDLEMEVEGRSAESTESGSPGSSNH